MEEIKSKVISFINLKALFSYTVVFKEEYKGN